MHPLYYIRAWPSKNPNNASKVGDVIGPVLGAGQYDLEGCIPCDGAQLLIQHYPELYRVIGRKYSPTKELVKRIEPTDTFGRLITHFFPDNFLVGRMRVDNPEYRDGYFNVPKIGTEQRSTIRHTFD